MTRSRTSWLVWLFALLVGPVTAATSARAQTSNQGGKYALLVGVRQYNKNELRTLPYTESDVETLAGVLIQAGYSKDNVVLMTQKTGAADTDFLPTGANIRAQLKLLLAPRRSGDTVLVAFAGHGVQFIGDQENYFCPADTKLGDKKGTLLPLSEVYKALADCKAGFKLLLVDACRNDPQVDSSRDLAKVKLSSEFRAVTTPPGGVAAFYSCSEGQKAFEHDKLKHGVFFHFVIEGLRGAADADRDRQVTLTELQGYVQQRVPDFVRAEYRVLQTPELKGTVRGSVALVSLSHVRPVLSVLEQAKGFVARREYDKALAGFTEAIRLDPRSAEAYEGRARIYGTKRDYDRAIADLTAAIRLNPKRALVYYMRGNAYRLKKDYDTAIADYTDAARIEPAASDPYFWRGVAYDLKKDYDRAIADFTEAIRRAPKGARGYYARGVAHARKKEYDEAIADYNRAVDLNPRDALTYSWRGSAHLEKKDYERAIADCTESIRLQPSGNSAPYLNRGVAFARRHDWEKAIADYTEAIRIDPRYGLAYKNRGIAHFQTKDYARAAADFTEALRIKPAEGWVLRDRGLAYQRAKDYDRALADYAEAIRLLPSDAVLRNNRGLVYAQKKDWKKAIADYTQAIRLNQKFAAAYANRARAYRASGDRTRAAADEVKAKRLAQSKSK